MSLSLVINFQSDDCFKSVGPKAQHRKLWEAAGLTAGGQHKPNTKH